jgi:beta-phosphoglucomutase
VLNSYSRLQAVIFDMDGVITHTMPEHFRAWKTVLSQQGLCVDYLDIYLREGQKGMESLEEIFAKYKMPFDHERGKNIIKQKENHFKKIVKKRFIKGSRRFLKRLHKRKLHLGLVTGTSRHELDEMLPGEIKELFSVIVTGSDVQFGKPHPEPYQQSLKQLNIKPHEAIVIENAPLGIRSAKQAGLKCLALATSLPKEYLKEADHIFKSFEEIQAFLSLN